MSTAAAREGARRSLLHRIIGPPSTRAGRWSAWLVGAVIGVLAAVGGLVLVGAADLGWGALLLLVLSSIAGVLTGIVAGGVAVASVAKGERSIIVLGPMLFGTVCLVFLVGVFVTPTS
jgi:hypothetical protein